MSTRDRPNKSITINFIATKSREIKIMILGKNPIKGGTPPTLNHIIKFCLFVILGLILSDWKVIITRVIK
jgi:hypothetical protein